MKKGIFIPALLGLVLIGGFFAREKYYNPKQRLDNARHEVNRFVNNNGIRSGDLVFHTSLSMQSKAIQMATKSKYSHCGIIYRENNHYYVFEAVQPVKSTPLEEWIARGKDGQFVIKRLKNADAILTPSTISKMKLIGEKFKGKNYDLTFEWSDEKMYCSELIWKIFDRGAGIQIGELQKLKDFDLTSGTVKQKMKERYGKNIPMDEVVISPVALFNSDLLTTVISNH